MKIANKLLYREFLVRENNIVRPAYQSEFDFYTTIKMGDPEKIKTLCTGDSCSHPTKSLSYNKSLV